MQRSQAELKELNLELENRVNERTAKLRETIGELQYISYSLTHDMRAPLRAVHGFGQLLLTESQDRLEPDQQDYLRKILVSSTRLDRLIRDALDYTQVAGAPVRLEPVDLAALLEGMLQSYPHLQPPNAEIRIEGKLPIVLGDEALLTQ
jgi:signal transduction histidine kinase